ncbi:MAG: GNAT family N-acetyltransferase [Acidimicrobiales bacterium]
MQFSRASLKFDREEALVVGTVTEVSSSIARDLNRLFPQLSSSFVPLGVAEYQSVVDQSSVTLFVYYEDDDRKRIDGALTLVMFTIPTGVRAWIEDVVVDESARGRGAGEALTRAAVEFAQQGGARSIDLTSRPSRVAANRLYQRIGFSLRATNVYRFE